MLHSRTLLFGLTVLVMFALSIAWGPSASAEQLRIETYVYSGNDAEPISHAVTLFESNAVYDFVDHPAQVAVFRPPTSSHPGQFILLDVANKTRTELSTRRIAGLIEKLTDWAAEQDDPMLKFSAKPDFEKSFDEQTGMLSLSNPLWSYRVATVPAENAAVLARYREFADWYTRLNTMISGSPPPGARLKLNEALEQHGVVPVEIHRQIDDLTPTLRATHLFSWRLSRADRARIETARRQLASFEKIENDKFIASRAKRNLVRGQSR